MSPDHVQLPFDGLPLDPKELAKLPAPERGKVYRRLDLDHLQIEAAEAGVRQVIARRYRQRLRRSPR